VGLTTLHAATRVKTGKRWAVISHIYKNVGKREGGIIEMSTHVVVPVGIAIRLNGVVADELRARGETEEAEEDGNGVRWGPEADEEGGPGGHQEG
jgi:hypothetical protein